ncbi:MAG: type II toxin-antitoxin system RelE/ParE family toxin [Vampirovibrionales bacterium]|nr:type II toxin-antitoxin system RelE/ParE family toxin [Vampirovibrionales bacterium]
MSRVCRWTSLARRDVRHIEASIAKHDPKTSVVVTQRIVLAVDALLIEYPEVGRVSRHPACREWVIPKLPYWVVYRVGKTTIDILRVLHTRQLWPATDP